MHENGGLGTHIYKYPYKLLTFSRLAGVTGHETCQGFGRNCEHCQFEFDSSTDRTYNLFSIPYVFLIHFYLDGPPACIKLSPADGRGDCGKMLVQYDCSHSHHVTEAVLLRIGLN